MSEEKKKESSHIYALKVTAGQERSVTNLVAARAQSGKIPIKAIMAPETIKGYLFIEAKGPNFVDEATAGIKHIQYRIPGMIEVSEMERYTATKPVIEELNVGNIVEIIGGPFKGMRAKITRVEKVKHDVTLELLEATFTLPITVHADYVKLVEKGTAEKK